MKDSKGDNWILKQDSFVPKEALAWEGLFTQGSGYLQARGSFEESFYDSPQNLEYERDAANVSVEKFPDQNSRCGTYIPGIYGKNPVFNREIINLPNSLRIEFYVKNEKLDLVESDIVDFSRSLNLKTGLLSRSMLWHSKAGANITLKYRRFVDAGSKHLILQQIPITSDKDTEIEVLSKIDADVRTNGRNHFIKTEFKGGNNTVFCNIETDCQDAVNVAFEMSGDNWNNRKDGELSRTITLETNKEVVLEKRSVFTTDRDRDVKSCLEILEDNRSNSFDDLFTRHADIWEKR